MEISTTLAQAQLDHAGTNITDEQRESQQYKIDDVDDMRANFSDDIDFLEDELKNIENEIQTMIGDIIKESEEQANKINGSKSTIYKLYSEIYSNLALLRQSLVVEKMEDYFIKNISEFYLFVYEKIIGETAFESEAFYGDNIKKGDNDDMLIQSKYGDSWFSPEAHKNYDIFIKEYHILAKKYHPDNEGSEVVFLDIQKEKELLLEQFK